MTDGVSTKRLSIIIPVYNGAEHLPRCVDSVLSQRGVGTHDLEILLLDDGSSDSSPDVIRGYERQHPDCVRGLHHPNMGVAATRNRGIDEAHGTYVMFIDQDDWIDRDYCRTFLDAIESGRADVVYGGYRRPDTTGRILTTTRPGADFYARFIVMAAWAKIHSRDFLLGNGVRFFSNKFGEDSVFTVSEICSTDRWHRINYVGYNWFYNEASVSNTSQRGLRPDDTDRLLALLNELSCAASKQRGSFAVRYFLLRTIVFYLLFSGRHSRPEDFLHAHKSFFSWYRSECGQLSIRESLGPAGETLQARLAILLMIVVDRLRLTPTFARAFCRPGGAA